MKNKIFSLVVLSMFALVFLASLGSALVLNSVSSNDFTRVGQSQEITVSADGPFNLTLPSTVFSVNPTTSGGANSAAFNFTLDSLPTAIGKNTFTVTAENSSNSTDTDTFDLTYVKSFCSSGPMNATDLTLDVTIDNNGEGDDNGWLPLDRIEVDVRFDNDLSEDLDDVIFELGLFKQDSTSNVADDLIWISTDDEEFDAGDVDENDDARHTFEFTVDPELDDGDYYLVVKAYPDGDESETCIDFSDNFDDSDFDSNSKYTASISIDKENDRDKMVVIDESKFPVVTEASCRDQVTVTADVWNIGDRDFEDQIKVIMVNSELGINLEDVIDGDFDAGDNSKAIFTFDVPEDATEKTYVLLMETYYDYDDDDESYDRKSDDTFRAILRVSDCAPVGSNAAVSATLQSGGMAGENLVVRATVANAGSSQATYTLSLSGYADWANSATADVSTFTLNAEQSREVLVTLAVKDDASGQKSFNLDLVSGTNSVLSQPVTVTIEARKSLFSGITGSVIGGNNFYLWGIVLLNVILVVAIIFVAVRLLRR